MPWTPYIALALLAGVINLGNAWQQLAYDCRYLIFFRPTRVAGVYLWTLAQLAFPSFLAWLVLGFNGRPSVGLALVGATILFGIGFVALMNATTQVAGLNIDILRKFYKWVIYRAKDWIATKETARTATFWQSCQSQLLNVTSLDAGFAYLRNYIDNDVSLSPENQKATLDGIDKVAAMQDRKQQVSQIKGLLAVRRRDLPIILQQFGCSNELIAALTQ